MSDSTEQIFVRTALTSWDQWVGRASKLFDGLSEERMLTPIAPGKNRPVYLLGHLIAVNDAMFPQLRLGDAQFAHLNEAFLKEADGPGADAFAVSGLREDWKVLNLRLSETLRRLTPSEWLERHALVSEEAFASEPHRNRLAILLSRTAHLSYHLGQLVVFTK